MKEPTHLVECVMLLGPPKPGQVLFIDGRCPGRLEEILINLPPEWNDTEVRVIISPNGSTIHDCIKLGEPENYCPSCGRKQISGNDHFNHCGRIKE